ncbi:MAG TPA: hypothetical protein DCS07_03160 [Bdellovibrionales bacterium]|nr:MAG: hypothetical protein A2Z97_09465 [Bdellovibrionales bacterium GWB1_52_6]OFZ03625.1 MAG: hypothetical protein A2X97_00850 [Bdellovibrionales bacterium GWA1_52_35]OFZ41633.1 MAG: hypothetical protein A2070_10635 [Bdellovibrionales bacterium GWC1_52_8]HAR41623.1 hypothetical protein [Bdellovibrionales bacterium]HCM40651.1 hypothetical protein [Bdellovibrionales bacterium]
MTSTRLFLTLFLFSGALYGTGTAVQAGQLHETYYVESSPEPSMIQKWSRLPGTRNFLFRVSAPSQTELEMIGRLERASLLQLESTTYPERTEIKAWQKLASKGAQFIGLDLQLPNPEQIQILNEIGFSRIIFLMTYIPDTDEGRRLGQLNTPVSVTFATTSFPRYDDRELLLAIPKTVPLTFVGSYWPGYTHMDLFNMLPNSKRLRISGEFPNDDQFPYLNNIDNLQELTIETSFAPPSPTVWEQIANRATRWICRDWVPTEEELQDFARSARPETGGTRNLIIDKDGELFPEERARLERMQTPVEWVHSSAIGVQRRSRSVQ